MHDQKTFQFVHSFRASLGMKDKEQKQFVLPLAFRFDKQSQLKPQFKEAA